MKRYIFSLAVVVLLAGRAGVVRAADSPEKAAQKIAEAWMPLWDSGQYGKSYEELAAETKKVIPQKQWFDYWSAVREPLGKLKSRKLIEAEYVKSLPGLPGREGAVLRYEGSFENKESLVETFALIRQKDGVWRVANYITPDK